MSGIAMLGSDFDLVMGIAPLDLQTARSGDYVSLKDADRLGVLFIKGAGTAGDDPTLTLRQATSVAGGSVKDWAVITDYALKEEAAGNLQATGTWTRVTQTAAATIAFDATSAESSLLGYFEVMASELDVANGFDCAAVNIGDVGSNAQLGCVMYILGGLRYQAAPANLPNSIID